jgi:hypothetical protein
LLCASRPSHTQRESNSQHPARPAAHARGKAELMSPLSLKGNDDAPTPLKETVPVTC